jgi:ElaB/YqjD/DUF883 family membrane-anchored ribosome-binding protein
MNEDNIEGAVKNGAGKVESFAGDALGDPELKLKGETLKAEGRLQDAVGTVHEAIDKVAGRAKAAAETVNTRATDVYDKVSRKAQDVAARVDPFVEQQPYAALGVAAAAGLLAGLLLASRGPKVIYVKSRS